MQGRKNRTARAALCVALLGFWAALAGFTTVPYPRIFNYNIGNGSGVPFAVAPYNTGTRVQKMLQNYARWNVVTPYALTLGSPNGVAAWHRPDITAWFHAYRNNLVVLPYFNMNFWFHEPAFVPTAGDTTMQSDEQWTRVLYNQNPPSSWVYAPGGIYHGGPGGGAGFFTDNWGNHAYADSMTKMLVRSATLRDTSGRYASDGIFLDTWVRKPSVVWNNEGPFDLTRMGYASGAAMDTAFDHEMTATINALRAARGPTFKIVINDWTKDPGDIWNTAWGINGLLIEGFFLHGDGFWASNQNDVGHAVAFITSNPSVNMIRVVKAEKGINIGTNDQYSAASMRAARTVLAVSCLGDGYASYADGPSGNTWPQGYFDEYSVNSAGQADTLGNYPGWLGNPLGAFTQDANGVYVREFDYGAVLVDTSGSPLTHDFGSTKYKCILGLMDPTVNDGVRRQIFTVPAFSGLFVTRLDANGSSPKKKWFNRNWGR